jgi:polysaccharide export outer membrane protein
VEVCKLKLRILDTFEKRPLRQTWLAPMAALLLFVPAAATAQGVPPERTAPPSEESPNRRLEQLRAMLPAVPGEYRIGPEDLIEVSVFEAADLNRSVRVTGGGEISLPLLGAVRAAGLTPRELESVLEELLRRTYLKDPHVGVFVREMQSHPVSVVGAVKKPGVFQIRGAKTLVEMLAMAEGLSEDAGDTILVSRGGGIAHGEATDSARKETISVDVKGLLESGDARRNVAVYAGDTVRVARAGIVYVVGEVKKPGGFLLRTNESISVLQALALSEGLLKTAAKSRARIIRIEEESGTRSEISVDLGKILKGTAADPALSARDILFVPGSGGRAALYKSGEAALQILSGVIIWRR